MSAFRDALSDLINEKNKEAGSNTPDFVLANYLGDCLDAFDEATKARDGWYGIAPEPGMETDTDDGVVMVPKAG